MRGHTSDMILRERFVYEERREILKWRAKRKNRLEEIENDVLYQFEGEFVVVRPRVKLKANLRRIGLAFRKRSLAQIKKGLEAELAARNTYKLHVKSIKEQKQWYAHTKPGAEVEYNEDGTPKSTPVAVRFRAVDSRSMDWLKMLHEAAEEDEAKSRPAMTKKNEGQKVPIPEFKFLGLYSGITYSIDGEIINTPRRVVNFFGEPGEQELTEDVLEELDNTERGFPEYRMRAIRKSTAKQRGLGIREPKMAGGLNYPTSTMRRDGYLRDWDIELSGQERYPRTARVAKVHRDSERVRLLTSGLSQHTQRLLNKNMDIESGVTVWYPHPTDLGRERGSSRETGTVKRLGDILCNIVTLSVVNRDFNILNRAYPLLIRIKETDIRATWTIGLELLVWKREQQQNPEGHLVADSFMPSQYTQGQSSRVSRSEDEQFLEWLIVSYPSSIKVGHTLWKDLPRAKDLQPTLIMNKLRFNNPKSALERIEELLLEPTYSENPVYYFYMGVAYIQLARTEQPRKVLASSLNDESDLYASSKEMVVVGDFDACGQYITKARSAFDQARERGGIFPENIINFEMELIDNYVEKGIVDNAHFVPTMNEPPVKSVPKYRPLYTVFDKDSTIF